MSKTLLLYHLQSKPHLLLRNEFGEAVIMMYNVLKAAVKADSDTISITADHIYWYRQGSQVGSFGVDDVQPRPGWRACMQAICHKDSFMGDYCSIIFDTPQEVRYALHYT